MSSVLRFDEWQDSDGNPVASGVGGFSAPGSIIAVKDVLKTDTFSASVAAGNGIAVTDLEIVHALSDAANKLLITAFFGQASATNAGDAGLAVTVDGSAIGVGDSAGSRATIGAGSRTTASGDNNTSVSPSVCFVYEPGDTASHTYRVSVVNLDTTTKILHVNKTSGDTDDARGKRTASSLVIQEVAV